MATTMPELAHAELFRSGAAGAEGVLSVDNPATRELLGEVAALSASETEAVLLRAHAVQPGWAKLAAGDRARILHRFADLMLDRQDDLARILVAEQGKPMAEASGEIAYAASFLSWFAEEGRRAYGEMIPGVAADQRLLVMKRPVGLAAAITPWNFPAAMITRKVAPALAAGCAIVVKPSEHTPFTALALEALAHEAGLPEGLFAVVTGHAHSVGSVLTGHAAVAKFSFTGSTAVGRLLTAQCAPTMKRVSMELGGNAPLIVFDDADIDAAVEGAMVAKFRNSGQTCVCANRILVHSSIHDRFAEALVARAAALAVGNGLDGPTQQGPLITRGALERVQAHVADAVSRGGRLLTGGGTHPAGENFFWPTVIAGAHDGMRLASEETFGPVAPLFRFESEAEAIALANATRSGLAAYAFSRDIERFWRVSEALEVGMVGFNTGAISSEVVPFGGVKESGLGREGSRHGLDEYLDMRLVCLRLNERGA